MRFATFNILADACTKYGSYNHTNPSLMEPGARHQYIARQVNNLNADVIGLQEVDRHIVEVFREDARWQSFWTPKTNTKPDGCLTLAKQDIAISSQESYEYDDNSGHIFQITQIGKVAVANTHIKWSSENAINHIGLSQTGELLRHLSNYRDAIILADCNGQPGGCVQTLIKQAGFHNISETRPTAFVNNKPVSIDALAIRGLKGTLIPTGIDVCTIPNTACASDHLPVVADIVMQHTINQEEIG